MSADYYLAGRTLERAKRSLRVTHNEFDEDLLEPLIIAAKLDLKATGAKHLDNIKYYPLVERAIIHYCHVNFPLGGDIKEIERHQRAYESVRNTLSMVGDIT